jgi:tetratricopeptide (TPR) repeat protein
MMLMKKSTQVADLSAEEMKDDYLTEKKAGMLKNIFSKIRWEDIKHFLLAILEKITRKSRMIFLKLENKFGSWSNNIRSTRQARAEKKIQDSAMRQENDIIRKLKDYKSETSGGQVAVSKEDATVAETAQVATSGKENSRQERIISSRRTTTIISETNVRPIISERVVKPKNRAEIKDRLEDLLIDRIAINPRDIEAYERLGEYYMEIKSYSDAKECFKQVIKLSPSDRNAKYRLRRLENILAKN